MKKYIITALAENTTFRHNCLAQHGQSILIEVDDYKLLFDVGEVPGAVSYNLKQLGVSINSINDVLISHRHIDHIGALPSMLADLKNQRLFLPLQLGVPHIKQHPEKYNFLKPNENGEYDLAVGEEDIAKINEYGNIKLVDNDGFELGQGIFTTGCIGNSMLEQAIVIDQKELGLTVILGCSHPTVEELVKKAMQVTGNNKLRGLVGGMHYTDFTEDEMIQKAKELGNMGVEFIMPGHCTTMKGSQVLKTVLGEKVKLSKTGTFGAGNSIIVGEKIDTLFV